MVETLDTGRAHLSLLSPLTGLGTAVGALDAVLLAGSVAAGLLCLVLLGLAAVGRLDPLLGPATVLPGVVAVVGLARGRQALADQRCAPVTAEAPGRAALLRGQRPAGGRRPPD